MFFDTVKTDKKDETYNQYLIAIAKKQNELLNCRFDMETKKVKEFETTGFLKKRCPLKEQYDVLCSELDALKQQTIQYRREQGASHGTFWWNLPWEQIEEYLIYDLLETTQSGKWRYAYTWQTEKLEDGVELLILVEEGHCSDFSTSGIYETKRESKYSLAEQENMVRRFNDRQNLYALTDLALGEARVHSTLSGQDYDSKAEYYLSSEYISMRYLMSSLYEQSLYKERITTGVTAYSNSRHYKCVYSVAEYHADAFGQLDYMLVDNFRYCGGTGSIDQYIENQYDMRDAAVACAFHLAKTDEIAKVPIELFGMNIQRGAIAHEELVRQAEIFTCLANKIKC